jgi:hypothetical protein
MTIDIRKEISVLIADYAPAEATKVLGAGPNQNCGTFIYAPSFSASVYVQAFLNTFNRQNYLYIFSAGLLNAGEYEEPSRYRGKEVHLGEHYSSMMEGYRAIQELFVLNADYLNGRFQAIDFPNTVFGYGYLRPEVECMMHGIQISDSDVDSFDTVTVTSDRDSPKIEIEDPQFVAYATAEPMVAEETAKMLSAAGVVATDIMTTNAHADAQTGVVKVIES